MKSRSILRLLLILAIIGVLRPSTAHAADKNELKQRSEKRYPELQKLKAEGIIGETSDGMVEVVEGKDASAEARKLVDEENGDRRELYAILAKEGNTTAEQVARHAALRNFERARPGEFLKQNGKWHQK